MMTETSGTPTAEAAIGGAGDGLGLAPLLGADAGIGAGRIDEAHHGKLEAVGHLHQPHRLAVAFGPRHAEIVLDAAFGVGALLMADQHHRAAGQAADAADDGLVLAEIAVAGERGEVLDQRIDVMPEMRALGMAGDLRLLPRRQLGIGFLQGFARLGLELGEFLFDRDRALLGGERFQLGDLALQLGDGLFEIEISTHPARGLA